MDAAFVARADGIACTHCRTLFRHFAHRFSCHCRTHSTVQRDTAVAPAIEMAHRPGLARLRIHRNPADSCHSPTGGILIVRRLGTYPLPTVLLGVFTLTVLLAVVVAASTSTASFSAYNGAWDGTNTLQSISEEAGGTPQITDDTAAYGRIDPNRTVAIILSPDQPYTTRDYNHIRQFVNQGGTLLVADDYGPHTNPLLKALGADARLDGRSLRDDQEYYKSPALPIAPNVSNHTLVAHVSQLTFNHGTAVVAHNATVLVRSSEYAYLDTNRNGTLDDSERIATRPVATVESVGQGRIIVVGDSGIMINAMLDRPGNRAFARQVVTGHETVLLDYSHTVRLPPLALAVLLIRKSTLLQIVLGAIGIGVVYGWTRTSGMLARLRSALTRSSVNTPTLDETAMLGYLQRQHPEWEDDRLQRVIEAMRERRDE